MKKLVLLLVLTATLVGAGAASAWVYPPVVVPFDSVVLPAPLGLPPVLVGPIHQGPWDGTIIWRPGPYVDGYDLVPEAPLPLPVPSRFH
jgi:hypothetical protein